MGHPILDLLHRPLPPLSAQLASDAGQWIADSVSLVTPQSIRKMGVRRRALLATAERDGSLRSFMLVKESWLGERFLSATDEICKDLPIEVSLAVADLYETSADLPAAASRNLVEAVSLRIETLSPSPPEEIRFALGQPKEDRPGRVRVPVAIARTQHIDAILRSSYGDRIAKIGARLDDRGRLTYTFHRRPLSWRSVRGAPLALVVLALSAAFFFAGLGAFLQTRLDAATAYEDELRRALRAEHETSKFLADVSSTLDAGVSPARLESYLAMIGDATPEKIWIERLSISSSGVLASGYVSENAAWPLEEPPTLSPSGRPGIQSFEMNVARGVER